MKDPLLRPLLLTATLDLQNTEDEQTQPITEDEKFSSNQEASCSYERSKEAINDLCAERPNIASRTTTRDDSTFEDTEIKCTKSCCRKIKEDELKIIPSRPNCSNNCCRVSDNEKELSKQQQQTTQTTCHGYDGKEEGPRCCQNNNQNNSQQTISTNCDSETTRSTITLSVLNKTTSKREKKEELVKNEAVITEEASEETCCSNGATVPSSSNCCTKSGCTKTNQIDLTATTTSTSSMSSGCIKSCCKKASMNLSEVTTTCSKPLQETSSCCTSGKCSKKSTTMQHLSQIQDCDESSIAVHIKDSKLTILHLTVQQLHCSDCATMVEETLLKRKGISQARVMDITNSARIVYDSSLIGEDEIIEHIESSSMTNTSIVSYYFLQEVAPQQITLLQQGMKDQFPKALSGSFYDSQKRILTIHYDPDQTGARSLKDFISLMLLVFVVPMMHELDAYLEQEIIQGLNRSVLLCWLLATPIQFYFGKPLYLSAYRALRYARKPNMDTLVMLSTTTAYLYSVVNVVVAFFLKSYHAEVFFETSAMLLTFIILGRFLEMVAKGQTSNMLSKMMELKVNRALWIHTKSLSNSVSQLLEHSDHFQTTTTAHNHHPQEPLIEEEIDIHLVQRGDILKVLPGSRIPTDGIVIHGTTSVDESMISGESMPVPKRVHDSVFGSTINQNGTIFMKVTKIASENTLAAIDKLIRESQSSKVPIQRIADTVSAYFVPIIMILSALAFALWISLAYSQVLQIPEHMHPFTFALQFALAILVISCPCAISLAAPTAVMVGIGMAAKFGVLVKSGQVMEMCHKVNCIIFDKTGTVTHGKPVVTDIEILEEHALEWSEEKFLQVIGSAEMGSEHIIGKAIVEHVHSLKKEISLSNPTDYVAEPGKGLTCSVSLIHTFATDSHIHKEEEHSYKEEEHSYSVAAGHFDFILEHSKTCPPPSSFQERIHQLENEGKTVVCVAINSTLIGMIALADTPKEEASLVVHELKQRGIEVWMISGDNPRTTQYIASQIGIDHFMGGVLPAEKAQKVKELQYCSNTTTSHHQKQQRTVCMVGDGINDSPSLAAAHVGMAIGAGSDIALETADVVLVKSNLKDVLVALDLSKTTFQRIKMNFAWAFFYNLIGIPLAAGALFPVLGVTIPPALAGLSEIFSSLPVVLFSLMLKTFKPRELTKVY
ncbi:hypothetical protein C9374_002694 [Naegleria lovaniensis]|uniref:P-type Cu(+) transporter n=1 Tax=Naegleria lovaniensis TaxID=51637 RepID=A0AA88GUI9_NAELO|nr:uncharacterized protein C9374_002694 [Naegleria lovaniensis]KAG2386248.1 hypothetical protein C9374_002694 [Naegleria lovaniensis]